MKRAIALAHFRRLCVASVVALASASAAADTGIERPAATHLTLAGAANDDTALIRADSRQHRYRRLPRSEARLPDEDDAHTDTTVALDARRNASVLNRRAALSTAPSHAGANADGVVQPHQTYALMSAGLLSMALVMIRRRRL